MGPWGPGRRRCADRRHPAGLKRGSLTLASTGEQAPEPPSAPLLQRTSSRRSCGSLTRSRLGTRSSSCARRPTAARRARRDRPRRARPRPRAARRPVLDLAAQACDPAATLAAAIDDAGFVPGFRPLGRGVGLRRSPRPRPRRALAPGRRRPRRRGGRARRALRRRARGRARGRGRLPGAVGTTLERAQALQVAACRAARPDPVAVAERPPQAQPHAATRCAGVAASSS